MKLYIMTNKGESKKRKNKGNNEKEEECKKSDYFRMRNDFLRRMKEIARWKENERSDNFRIR